jgi:methylmalonic aciduria homocystinuria type C protein
MPTSDDWQAVTAAVAAQLAPQGLDIVHPFAVRWFNAGVAPAQRLPAYGRADALGLLIGNTRALWAPLRAAYRVDTALQACADPVDSYVEERVYAALAPIAIASSVWCAHFPRRLAIQRLADVTGLAPLSAVGLNVHPLFGPWLALRAAVVLDMPGPAGAAPATLPSCPDCARTCMPAFERARAAQADEDDIAATWPLWLAVRDACPVGRAHRYSEEQIRYHYARDRSVLA